MKLQQGFFHSSIGRKWIVAVTGIGLLGFVFAHLSGNLLIWAGAEKFNAYGQTLKDLGPLLWVARIGLLGIFILHQTVALCLAKENCKARPTRYAQKKFVRASLPSRYMVITGIVLFWFIVYHLAHFTFHWVHDTGEVLDLKGRHDIYQMVVLGFQQPILSSIYILAMFFLAFHIRHAIPSVFQTLGFNHPKYNQCIDRLGLLLSVLVFAGYVSIPSGVLFGCIAL